MSATTLPSSSVASAMVSTAIGGDGFADTGGGGMDAAGENSAQIESNVTENFTIPVRNITLCGDFFDVSDYAFWCAGVFVSVIGLAGFVGNLLALIVLSRPKLRDVFHQQA